MSALDFYYTGGGSASGIFGGPISSLVLSESLSNVFPSLTAQQGIDGLTTYVCVCIKNIGTNAVSNAGVYFSGQTTDSALYIAKGLTGKNSTTEQTIATSSTAPVGDFVFVQPVFDYDLLNVGPLSPGEWHHLWIKRIFYANTPGNELDEVILTGVG